MKLLWDCNVGWLQGWPAQVQVIADGRGSSVIEEVLRFEKNKLFWFFFLLEKEQIDLKRKCFEKTNCEKNTLKTNGLKTNGLKKKMVWKKKMLWKKKLFKNPENISMLLPWERKKKFCSCEILKKVCLLLSSSSDEMKIMRNNFISNISLKTEVDWLKFPCLNWKITPKLWSWMRTV